jgi:D-mannonate dehydratase
MRYIKTYEESNSYQEGDWVIYKVDDKEKIGCIEELRTSFFSYDDIRVDFIISDKESINRYIVKYDKIIRKLTDLELNVMKYNL